MSRGPPAGARSSQRERAGRRHRGRSLDAGLGRRGGARCRRGGHGRSCRPPAATGSPPSSARGSTRSAARHRRCRSPTRSARSRWASRSSESIATGRPVALAGVARMSARRVLVGLRRHRRRRTTRRAMYLPGVRAAPGFTLVGVVDAGGTDRAAQTAERARLRQFADWTRHSTRPTWSASPRRSRTAAAWSPTPSAPASTCWPTSRSRRPWPRRWRSSGLAAEHDVVVVPAHHQRLGGALRSARAAVRAGRVGLPWNVQADFLVAGGDPAPDRRTRELRRSTRSTSSAPSSASTCAGCTRPAVARRWSTPACSTTTTASPARSSAGGRRALRDVPPGGLAVHRYRISGSHGVLAVDAAKPALQVRTAATAGRGVDRPGHRRRAARRAGGRHPHRPARRSASPTRSRRSASSRPPQRSIETGQPGRRQGSER